MKRMMIATVLLVGLTAVHAQDRTRTRAPKDPAAMEQHAQDRAEKQTDAMVKELGLDKTQAAKVQDINARFASSLMDMRAAGLSEDAKKEKSKTLHQQHNEELKGVLTPEQFEKMKTLGKDRRAARGDQMKEKDPAKMQEYAAMRAEKHTDSMTEELGLTKEQSAKVETINGSYAASMAKLKQAGVDETAHKAQAKELREKRDAELKTVLTPEQYAKMVEMRKAKHAESMEKHKEMKKPHNE